MGPSQDEPGVINAAPERDNLGRDALDEFGCPRCGLSLQLRMAVEHCPRCLVRERRLVRLQLTSAVERLPPDAEED